MGGQRAGCTATWQPHGRTAAALASAAPQRWCTAAVSCRQPKVCIPAAERTLAAHTLLYTSNRSFIGHVGSVTRHLQLLTGSAVKVDCLAMEPVPAGTGGLPPVVHEMLAAPLLQREVRASPVGREAVHTGCHVSHVVMFEHPHLHANTLHWISIGVSAHWCCRSGAVAT